MKIALGHLAAALTITFVAGCGNSSSGGNTSSPEALCQGICGNEAKLACPNGNEAGCNTGPNGVTDKQTIVLSDASAGGGAFVAQSVQSTNGAADQRGTLMGTPSGTTVSLLITCPASGPFGDFPYTATATSFTLYNTL